MNPIRKKIGNAYDYSNLDKIIIEYNECQKNAIKYDDADLGCFSKPLKNIKEREKEVEKLKQIQEEELKKIEKLRKSPEEKLKHKKTRKT